jgi:hydrogenase-4 component E
MVVKIAPVAAGLARDELALAMAIVLLGFLMMIVRRNAVTQVVGFMSMENGLILAATGAQGMPLVVEVSVAFSVLIALFVFAVFVFRIRERFDTIDIEALDRMRGDRR